MSSRREVWMRSLGLRYQYNFVNDQRVYISS
jgi:hypothetical protein